MENSDLRGNFNTIFNRFAPSYDGNQKKLLSDRFETAVPKEFTFLFDPLETQPLMLMKIPFFWCSIPLGRMNTTLGAMKDRVSTPFIRKYSRVGHSAHCEHLKRQMDSNFATDFTPRKVCLIFHFCALSSSSLLHV